jgi:hypothetical protein
MQCEKCGGTLPSKQELWRTATMVGHWFIGFDDDGRPEVAGRITGGLGAGRYLIAYSFIKPGVKAEPTLNKDSIASLGWLLFDNQSMWRTTFTEASSELA